MPVAVVLLATVAVSFMLVSSGPLGRGDDSDYAVRVFDGVVAYDRVLASRISWVAEPEDVWGCTFALVELPAAAALTPGKRANGEVAWYLEWGGDWKKTPVDHPGLHQRDTIRDCASNWSPDVETRLLSAISEPGSFYARDGVGETVYVYSAKLRIAARIRFGD